MLIFIQRAILSYEGTVAKHTHLLAFIRIENQEVVEVFLVWLSVIEVPVFYYFLRDIGGLRFDDRYFIQTSQVRKCL